jgi:hypothetical protein
LRLTGLPLQATVLLLLLLLHGLLQGLHLTILLLLLLLGLR